MKLYDDAIQKCLSLLTPYEAGQCLTVSGGKLQTGSDVWTDAGERNMILRSDMAYELGGDTLPAVSGFAVTSDKTLVPEDEILVYGPDLPEIKADTPYARLAIARVKEDSLGEGNAAYNAIRKIEYTRYHLNPKGFMMRISASSERESVRIGKDALAEGLNFAKAGQMFLDSYHANPQVEAVKLIFITDKNFPYKELTKEVQRLEQITSAIDHIFKNLIMDCKVCNLKEICDEVEGMKELHFAQTEQK